MPTTTPDYRAERLGGVQSPIMSQRRINNWHLMLSEGGDDSAISSIMNDDFFGTEVEDDVAAPTTTYVPTYGSLRPPKEERRWVRRRWPSLIEYTIEVPSWPPMLAVTEIPVAEVSVDIQRAARSARSWRLPTGLSATVVDPEGEARAKDDDETMAAILEALAREGDL